MGYLVAQGLFSLMEPLIREAIEKIHASGARCVIHTAGGGNQGLSWLLGVRGASRSVLEAQIPYSHASFRELISNNVKVWNGSYCSQDAAQALARAAYRRAIRLSNFGETVIGVAATATLATEREIRGGRRAFVAAEMNCGVARYELRFNSSRGRWTEDETVGRLLIQALYDCVIGNVFRKGVGESQLELVRKAIGEKDELSVPAIHERGDILEDLTHGKLSVAEYYRNQVAVGATRGNIFLPGSFNPLHKGHVQLLEAASKIGGGNAKPCFELSAVNVDKPPLSRDELLRRLKQFEHGNYAIVITSVPRFDEKAEIFPGSSFVIGYDTAVRLLMPKYYDNSEEVMYNSLIKLVRYDCDFIVAGRVVKQDDGTEKYMTLADIDIPMSLRSIFRAIPESLFRNDISSTALRKQKTT